MVPRASLLLLPLVGVIFLALHAAQGAELRRVCYYTNWSQYRPDKGKFTPENVDPNLCTHYVYAFAILLGNRVKAFEWNDLSTQWSKGMFERFMALKRVNPRMKTLLAIGGWNFGSKGFHEMSHTPQGRKEFADSVVKFIRENNFDGVDVDWEYPANRGSPPEDKHHYTEMLQAVRDAIVAEAQQSGRPRLLFTAAVAAGKSTIDTAYEIPEISQILDYISVMAYDLHGSWENITGHNSPMYSRVDESQEDKYLNLHWAAEYWVKMGAPREKLNIGLALYGRTFTLSTADNTLGAPVSGPGAKGPYSREKGFLSYQEICEMERNGGTIVDIPEQRVRYITRGDQWVGYDDKLSLRQKACYIKTNGFGGVMVWALDLDDFSGSDCGQGPYPLLRNIVAELASPGRTNCVGPGPHQDINHGSVTTKRPVATTTRKTYTTPSTMMTNKPQVTNGPIYTTSSVQPGNDFCYGRISDFYPSPFSCTKYILCVNGQSIGRSCTMGLRFNPQTKYCDRADNVQCNIGNNTQSITSKPNTPPPSTSTQRPSTQRPSTQRPSTQRPSTQTTYNPTSPQIQSGKDFCYGRISDFYPSPYSCAEYIVCVNGMSTRIHCAVGLLFNPQIKSCDHAANVSCNIGTNTQWTAQFISTTTPPPTSTTTRRPTAPPITFNPYTPLPYTWRLSSQRPSTQRPFTQNTYIPTSLNAYCGNRADGLYRDSSDCSKFFECNAHIGFLRICPPYMAFNENTESCDFPYKVPGC
ncbi:chitotriosidase-1-like [Haliotis asinina]|uniref:chitotriosidase-1-like n=1 Tax=Haliotis asinina TaxID=109174 RepID=UPI0035321FE9